MQEIYRKYPHHLLLTLDHFDTYFEQEVERQEEEDGDVSKTAHYTLVTKSGWALYDSTGTVLDQMTLSQNEPYNLRGAISGLLAIGPALSKAGPVINFPYKGNRVAVLAAPGTTAGYLRALLLLKQGVRASGKSNGRHELEGSYCLADATDRKQQEENCRQGCL